MLRTLCTLLAFSCLPAIAQAPSPDALVVSLKTMSKTLASCRSIYTQIAPGHKEPMFEELLGQDDYGKDISSLRRAQLFTDFLIAHPNKISGSILVMILSTSDDFALGLQSTQTEILRHLVLDDKKINAMDDSIVVALDSLSNCQHRLFDAGDVYVDVTLKYIEAEDKATGKAFVPIPHQ